MLQFISLVIVDVLMGGSEATSTPTVACDTTTGNDSTLPLVSTEDATVGVQLDLTCEEQCILDFVGAARGACLRLCKLPTAAAPADIAADPRGMRRDRPRRRSRPRCPRG